MDGAASSPVYRRVLLKLSGEALSGEQNIGIKRGNLTSVAEEVASVAARDVQVAVVIGGGNFFRGVNLTQIGLAKSTADYIGMLATVMNALALQQALGDAGASVRIQSAIPMTPIAEPYVRARAIRHLEKGRIVIFAAGTGSPFFTTDTAASLRAVEIGADVILKATKVDGVYTDDPVTNASARKYDRVSYDEVLEKRLGVMDATAIALCREYNLPLRVFAMAEPGRLLRVVNGDNAGSLIV